MYTELDAFISSLAKFTSLTCLREMKEKRLKVFS